MGEASVALGRARATAWPDAAARSLTWLRAAARAAAATDERHEARQLVGSRVVAPAIHHTEPSAGGATEATVAIEALGGSKVEKVYTLLDHHELAPSISYEVSIGDVHAGDSCHVPVLIWLPPLAAASHDGSLR